MANPVKTLTKLAKNTSRSSLYVHSVTGDLFITDSSFLLRGRGAGKVLEEIDPRYQSIPEGQHKYENVRASSWTFRGGQGPDCVRLWDREVTDKGDLPPLSDQVGKTPLLVEGSKEIPFVRILKDRKRNQYIPVNDAYFSALHDLTGCVVFRFSDDPLSPLVLAQGDEPIGLLMPMKQDAVPYDLLRPLEEVVAKAS